MKKYYIAPLVIVAALMLAGASIPAMAQDSRTYFALTSPAEGQIVAGGQTIDVAFELRLDKALIEHPWAEMEFFLETGEGVHVRITPQMRLSTRSFRWTVPNITTRTARLSLQAGIEGEGDHYRFYQTGTFTIKSARGGASILLNSPSEKAKAGRNLDLSWTSNLPEGSSYDVMISYDRGAHFHRAGTTVETRFALPVEKDFAGSITVQIVHTLADGNAVRSLQTRDATIVVGDGDR
jgi:hypothetical protein